MFAFQRRNAFGSLVRKKVSLRIGANRMIVGSLSHASKSCGPDEQSVGSNCDLAPNNFFCARQSAYTCWENKNQLTLSVTQVQIGRWRELKRIRTVLIIIIIIRKLNKSF